MKRTQIQLTEEQTEKLDEVAQREGLSRSELIRRAVDDWLSARSVSTVDEKRKRARDPVGAFSSGERDVSRRHDEYLENGYAS